MKIKVTIQRSNEWVKQQCVETGENVRKEIKVEIDTTELSIENRERILGYLGSFEDLESLRFDSSFLPSRYGYGYGTLGFFIDSNSPTAFEINSAIELAWKCLEGRQAERLVLEEKRNAEIAAKNSAEEERKKKLQEAREILKKELEELESYKNRLDTLSEFVSQVPLDALRGTLKKIASSEESIEAIQDKIEDASTDWLFSNREDE